jgi:hypothetical protein
MGKERERERGRETALTNNDRTTHYMNDLEESRDHQIKRRQA